MHPHQSSFWQTDIITDIVDWNNKNISWQIFRKSSENFLAASEELSHVEKLRENISLAESCEKMFTKNFSKINT